MKPLNLDNRPCSPISSNCVIWQGPDIPCIKLCTGDSVSDVVAKLGTELCTIMDQLNVSNYDLSCLNLTGCAPADFHALMQLLITKICEANGTTVPTKSVSECPDCVVTVAPCFIQGTQTTMQLIDYVQMIANRVCSIIDEISNINNQISTINSTLADLQYQIDNLPTYTLPSIPVDCILGPGNHPLDTVVSTLMNDDTLGYCRLLQATGTPAEINSAVLSQCIADSDHALASGTPGTTFSAFYAGSWVNNTGLGSAPTVANAINNAWIAICDIYNFLQSGTPVAIVDAGNWIEVTSTVVGNETTYTVSEKTKPGLSVYKAPPANLNKTAPGLSTGRLCDGDIQIMDSIEYNDFGAAYDVTTGIFTVPTTGVYEMSFFTHYTRDAGNGWFDPDVPGMVISGIVSPVACNFYCVNSSSPIVIMKHCSINGSLVRKLTAGTQLCLKVINLTNYNYTSFVGDIVKFNIQRIS